MAKYGRRKFLKQVMSSLSKATLIQVSGSTYFISHISQNSFFPVAGAKTVHACSYDSIGKGDMAFCPDAIDGCNADCADQATLCGGTSSNNCALSSCVDDPVTGWGGIASGTYSCP
ncbi:MAG: hypothetical protein CL677_09665 [Bdellovibrionaceae bacterium]|nr:hypothetical protein [Pseudobdellovibrionaceae bacterium]|tara:strand:+ start:1021 stop:1368 length:348 start_codon:yes stop_codon:yes gene_type:complete